MSSVTCVYNNMYLYMIMNLIKLKMLLHFIVQKVSTNSECSRRTFSAITAYESEQHIIYKQISYIVLCVYYELYELKFYY